MSTPSVSAEDALKSLATGLSNTATIPSGAALGAASIGSLASSQVGQVAVVIDGKSVQTFALAVQTTFPGGTCLEQLFATMGSTVPQSTCTSPPTGLMLILWQTGSASVPPDRIVIVYADLGRATFSDFATLGSQTTALPSFAIYMDRGGAISISSGGSFTSSVKGVGQSCSLPLPPFATSATCSRATFTAAGHVSFVPAPFIGSAAGSHSLEIPATDVPGVVENITGLVKH
ncbi:MAG: hypothetical protein ACR2M1_11035 [Gemmatimonadaceae bacterium]